MTSDPSPDVSQRGVVSIGSTQRRVVSQTAGDKPRLVLATRNPHKVEELARILRHSGLDVELLTIDAFPDAPEVAETGATFNENALLKARAVADATGVTAVADDSGLCIDAMNGMPGIFSARWSGGHGDIANVELVLAQLEDVPDERRDAHFACAAAVAVPGGTQHVVLGRLDGRVTRKPRGSNGFGYDPIFESVDRPGLTTAELGDADKDAISHRGRALRALAPYLRDVLTVNQR
jgi:XTP/dITP diphosphohydrolase